MSFVVLGYEIIGKDDFFLKIRERTPYFVLPLPGISQRDNSRRLSRWNILLYPPNTLSQCHLNLGQLQKIAFVNFGETFIRHGSDSGGLFRF